MSSKKSVSDIRNSLSEGINGAVNYYPTHLEILEMDYKDNTYFISGTFDVIHWWTDELIVKGTFDAILDKDLNISKLKINKSKQ